MTAAWTLVIGTKRYSTWSLRPWLMLKAAGVEFDEIEIALRQPDTKENILKYSPSGKVPLLITPDFKVWDSLAIGEFLAEQFPQAGLWPLEAKERAWARAISAEMHSGFQTLRSTCPMDLALDQPLDEISPELLADLTRIQSLWTEALTAHHHRGPYLFGSFTIADAMFAPVVTRILTYHLPVNEQARSYCHSINTLPWLVAWRESALKA